MFDPQNMSDHEMRNVRDQAFYLLKKYTSYTFLERARELHQLLLNAFAKQLNDPESVQSACEEAKRCCGIRFSDGSYEKDYRNLLKELVSIEEGLTLLKSTPHKQEAYKSISTCDFDLYLSGRGAEERGLEDDPFYQGLGYANVFENSPMWKLDEGIKQLEALRQTTIGSTAHCLIDLDGRSNALFWAYDTILFVDQYGNGWPVPHLFPPSLSSCPPPNASPDGQIWSGEEIPVTGIWEPWFVEVPEKPGLLSGFAGRLAGKPPVSEEPKFTGKVGCPNYFLAGTTAFEYELEGTDQKAKVAWRLIWEDTRYLDGTIPEEEKDYFADNAGAAAAPVQVLTAYPGDPCPEAGEWYSVNWNGRKAVLQKGDPMPGPKYSSVGAVIWHRKR